MSGLSYAEANALLTASVLGGTTYLALLTADPKRSDTGSTLPEATYTGYARAAVPVSAWAAPANGSVANDEAITFASCTGGSATIVAFALCSAATAGSVKWIGVRRPLLISSTDPDPPTVAAGILNLSLD